MQQGTPIQRYFEKAEQSNSAAAKRWDKVRRSAARAAEQLGSLIEHADV